jgi:magnesium transporter
MPPEAREFDRHEAEALIRAGQRPEARDYLEGLPPSERARLLSRLDEDLRAGLFALLAPDYAAELLDGLGEAQAVEILETLPTGLAARVVDRVPSDEQADLLAECDREVAEKILAAMSPEEAVDARRLMQYEWDTAGGMMISEYLSFAAEETVRAIGSDMDAHREEYAGYDIQYLYLTDSEGRLEGVLPIRDLLLARPEQPARAVMIPGPVSVRVDQELHELYGFFQEHHYLGLPVVDAGGRLLGVLQRSAVEESMSEEATENYLKVSGLLGEDELRSMPLVYRSRRRLSWLSINVVLNVIAASVIALNQDILAQVIALAVFLPIISDMSGCSGNQAVGVSVRELTLGLVRPRELWHVFRKEIGVGLLNGAVLGGLVAVAGGLWQQNPWFGLVVGLALLLNTVVAVLIGGLVPLALKGLRLDPALASGPILTTVTDMCGFFLVLFLAGRFLPLLA